MRTVPDPLDGPAAHDGGKNSGNEKYAGRGLDDFDPTTAARALVRLWKTEIAGRDSGYEYLMLQDKLQVIVEALLRAD